MFIESLLCTRHVLHIVILKTDSNLCAAPSLHSTHAGLRFDSTLGFSAGLGMRVLCCCAQLFSPVWLFQTPWTVACQAPPSMGFPRQESWSGLPSPSPGDLPDPGTEPMAPVSPAASALPADSLSLSHWGNLKNLQFSSVQSLSHALLFATPWTAACQAPPSVRFPRQESWSGLPYPSPGDLPDPGIKPLSPALQADSLLLSYQGSPRLKMHNFPQAFCMIYSAYKLNKQGDSFDILLSQFGTSLLFHVQLQLLLLDQYTGFSGKR